MTKKEIIEALQSYDEDAQSDALKSAAMLKSRSGMAYLITRRLTDASERVQRLAAVACGALGIRSAEHELTKLACSSAGMEVRIAAIEALAKLGARGSLPALLAIRTKDLRSVIEAARKEIESAPCNGPKDARAEALREAGNRCTACKCPEGTATVGRGGYWAEDLPERTITGQHFRVWKGPTGLAAVAPPNSWKKTIRLVRMTSGVVLCERCAARARRSGTDTQADTNEELGPLWSNAT